MMMADPSPLLAEKPDILLMLHTGLPEDIESEARSALDLPNLNLVVIHRPGGPYAGVELYLPSVIALFVAAGFFNGVLQEAGKDAYLALKTAAIGLWKRASTLNVVPIGSAGKLSSPSRYSLAFSFTGEVVPGLNFKFLIETETQAGDVEVGVGAFVDLIDDLLNDRVGEDDVKALLTYKPHGSTVLVTFDAVNRKIVPVNAFEGRNLPTS